jgi:xylulokinase
MFQSDIFTEAFANTSGASIELVNTDGAQGAARGAGLGAGIYKDTKEAFRGLKVLRRIEPNTALTAQYKEAYGNWLDGLQF